MDEENRFRLGHTIQRELFGEEWSAFMESISGTGTMPSPPPSHGTVQFERNGETRIAYKAPSNWQDQDQLEKLFLHAKPAGDLQDVMYMFGYPESIPEYVYKGNIISAESFSGGVASVAPNGPRARPANPQWHFTLRIGLQTHSCTREASADDTGRGVKACLENWADSIFGSLPKP